MLRAIAMRAWCVLWALAGVNRCDAAIEYEGAVQLSPGQIIVGRLAGDVLGDGVLRVTPPSTLAAGTMWIAQGTPQQMVNGSVFVQGGAINVTGDLAVGQSGNGRLEISDAGVVDAGRLLVGGVSSNTPIARGTAIVDGLGSRLRWRTELSIGAGGDGELIVRNGAGLLPQQGASTQPAYIARLPGSTGNVLVEGPGSFWHHSGDVVVGGSGAATLRIANGGVVTTANARVGAEGGTPASNPRGDVFIDGVGSRWSLGTLNVAASNFASGVIHVTNGGTLETNASIATQGTSVIGAAGFGRVVVSGAQSRWLSPGQLVVGRTDGRGELYLEDGTMFATIGADVGQGGEGVVVVRGEHTNWQAASSVRVGQTGAGTIEVRDGASLTMMLASLGLDIGQRGRVILGDGNIASTTTRLSRVMNAGLLEGSGKITALQLNNVNGRMRINAGDRLRVDALLINEGTGRIEIFGGELEAEQSLVNGPNGRMILEDATLRARGPVGVESRGTFNVSAGRNRLFGAVTNNGSFVGAGDSHTTFYDAVVNAGDMTVSAGSTMTFLGSLTGNGVGGAGSVFLEGAVQPGLGQGVMNFGGDASLGGASSVSFSITGAGASEGNDRLSAGGVLALGGALNLEVLDELGGDVTVPIISAGELLGTFDALPAVGAQLGAGVRFGGVTYDYNRDEVLVNLLQGLPGDFNGDGRADGVDFLLWQRDLGSTEVQKGMGADANCDGAVDAADLALWSADVAAASQAPVSQGAPVPEPRSDLLTLVLGMGMLLGVGRGIGTATRLDC